MNLRIVPIAAVVMLQTACLFGSSRNDAFVEATPEKKPSLTFGDDQATLSTNAAELFAKQGGNPNPDVLVGIYERKGSGSELSPDRLSLLYNDWKVRLEFRKTGVMIAIQCIFKVDDLETPVTLVQSSELEAFDWGVRLSGAAKQSKRFTDHGFNVECALDAGPVDLPYCLDTYRNGGVYGNHEVPAGYSFCVDTDTSGTLTMHGPKGTQLMGEKIAN
jgi:hypothetical protein